MPTKCTPATAIAAAIPTAAPSEASSPAAAPAIAVQGFAWRAVIVVVVVILAVIGLWCAGAARRCGLAGKERPLRCRLLLLLALLLRPGATAATCRGRRRRLLPAATATDH